MTTARRYTMEQLETARKKLRNLPMKRTGMTRAEVAEFLVNDIQKAIRQGYSLQEIKGTLAQSGISVSLARMRALLECSDKNGAQIERERERESPSHIRLIHPIRIVSL